MNLIVKLEEPLYRRDVTDVQTGVGFTAILREKMVTYYCSLFGDQSALGFHCQNTT